MPGRSPSIHQRSRNSRQGSIVQRRRFIPALFVALARGETNENIQLFLDRHGVSGLVTALEYARDYVQGRANARLMAREQELPVLEAETILQELRDVLLHVDPELEASLNVDELDAAVDERRGE
jgi:hypothetical protein